MTEIEVLALMSAVLDSKNKHTVDRGGYIVGSSVSAKGIVRRAGELLRAVEDHVADEEEES